MVYPAICVHAETQEHPRFIYWRAEEIRPKYIELLAMFTRTLLLNAQKMQIHPTGAKFYFRGSIFKQCSSIRL